MDRQVLIISFWNPTKKDPHQGVFIQDQAAAVCSLRDNVVFLQVNVLPSGNLILKKEVTESEFFRNRRIIINLYSLFWKFYFLNPWLLAGIVDRLITRNYPGIKPALIHSNVIFPCGISSYILSQKTGAQMVLSEHWSKAENLLKHPFYRRTAMKAYLSNKVVIAVSEFLASKISVSTGHKNIRVIPNIVNTSLFSFVPKTLFDGNNLICTCVASWKPPKRLDLIIDALTSFVQVTGTNVYLNIVGNGKQTDVIKSDIIPENLHITLHGYLEKQLIVTLLQKSHIFMHASDTETFSVVTAEALSTGTPVLASNTGALPELVHELNGMLAENNAASWRKNIHEIVIRQFDHEAIARENQTRFSPEKIGNAIIEVYNKVLNDLE